MCGSLFLTLGEMRRSTEVSSLFGGLAVLCVLVAGDGEPGEVRTPRQAWVAEPRPPALELFWKDEPCGGTKRRGHSWHQGRRTVCRRERVA